MKSILYYGFCTLDRYSNKGCGILVHSSLCENNMLMNDASYIQVIL